MTDRETPDGEWGKIWEVFHRLLEEPVETRAAFLERECEGDAELRRELEELLEAHDSGLSLLDESPGTDWIADDMEETVVSDRRLIEVGTVLAGRFEIVRLIGVGGMGEVYEARDRELVGRLALKTLLPAMASSSSALARFRQEISLARQVTHRNVCRIFDLFQDGDLAFLTMELIQGETLAARLKRVGSLDLETARANLEQMVAGLEAAHEVGVVHRDLKPSNIMIVEEEGSKQRVVITDFGLATSDSQDSIDAAQLTRTGEVVGTPAYMAPEQLQGRVVSAATDVYALGLILYEMVTGQLPFTGSNAFSIAARRLAGPPPSPRVHLPDLDERWEAVIVRCLEPEATNRFERPQELMDALEDPTIEIAARPPADSRVRRGILAGMAVALLLAALVWIAQRDQRSYSNAEEGRKEHSAVAADGLEFAEQDTVLIVRFENRTGDPSLDGALDAALAHELANSSFVTVASKGRVRDALRLMRLPPETLVDIEIGREVALRDDGIRAVVSGTVDQSSATPQLAVSLVAPVDGELLETWSVEVGGGAGEIAQGVRDIAFSLRRYLGENPASLEQAGLSLEKVTTPSLRALRLYEEAEAVIARSGMDATSEELLLDAIRDDPDFASAHILLSYAIYNQDRGPDEYLPPAERALDLSDGVPERERYFIRASHAFLTGDLERARANYEALLRLHPDHYWGNSNLARLVGPTEGIPYEVRKAVHRPNDLDANWDAAHALAIIGGQALEAQPFIDQVIALATVEIPRWQDYEAAWARLWQANRHWVQGDVEESIAELDHWASELESQSGDEESWSRMILGRAYRSLGLLQRSREMMPLPDWQKDRTFFAGVDGYLDVNSTVSTFGEGEWGKRWWGDVVLQDPLRLAGLARANQLGPARRILDEFRTYQRAPMPDFEEKPGSLEIYMQGELALAEGRIDEALGLLERFLRLDRNSYAISYLLASQALSSVYLDQGRDDAALEVLARAVAQRGRIYPFGIELWMETQLQLAALYRRQGNAVEADRLEAELAGLMVQGDSDFWLVRKLAARRAD